jgi:hypothetical protein
MALQESKLRKKSRKEADIQSWINLLFVDSTRANNESMNSEQKPQQQYGLPNASVVARALQTSKLTEEQILLLMQNLYQRRNMASLTQDLQPQTDSVVWNESNTIFNTYARCSYYTGPK